jgi:hypothetical protein
MVQKTDCDNFRAEFFLNSFSRDAPGARAS